MSCKAPGSSTTEATGDSAYVADRALIHAMPRNPRPRHGEIGVAPEDSRLDDDAVTSGFEKPVPRPERSRGAQSESVERHFLRALAAFSSQEWQVKSSRDEPQRLSTFRAPCQRSLRCVASLCEASRRGAGR